MNKLEKINEYFERFPGVGARQARRFSFFILSMEPEETKELAELISSIRETVNECKSCRKFYAHNGNSTYCDICSDPNRDHNKLLVVERDVDITPIERSGVYDGLYFVLGGTLPLLETKETQRLRSNGLKKLIEARLPDGLSEIILAFSINPDGENTARFVESLISKIENINKVKVTELGRGLSTGSELEYSDPETIKNALKNRH